jgi:molybdenum cofactor synthesis domain-containing protein
MDRAHSSHGFTAAVVTVSSSCARGLRQDLSGPAVKDLLEQHGFQVVAAEIVPDDSGMIEQALVRLCGAARLVITTGGTGITADDVTPEATRAVADRLVEGIAEHMRSEGSRQTPLAILSRAVCGLRGASMILNLPGSLRGATESLSTVIQVLPHALELLGGKTGH